LQKLEPSFNANLRHLNIILPFRKLFNTDTASKVLSNDNKLVFFRKLRPNTSQPAMTWHILPAPKEKKRTFIKDLDPGTKIALRHTPLKEYLGSPEQLFSSRSQARLMLCDNKSATMATARCVANSDI
jgi:hypothetical protein